ncbi:kinesin light chain [Diplodia corticola]|uniref:Kinesin light chain n=1 Tax=Diplodia corticola TaxID=236234 RepID=A0A1J9RXQ7_9PEZI|nr:kinesin light chain [Diplodia corticola]OJD33143.1 kinesin light chain [Diplodia corticola]
MMSSFKRQFKRDDYTVAWICALHDSELLAARCMLDEEHKPIPQDDTDRNIYHYGSIKGHNVVVACMPAQKPGPVSAASLVQPLRSSFRSLMYHLFVGIGGGVPLVPGRCRRDVRLGHVVVGWPDKTGEPAVIGWDYGYHQEVNGRQSIRPIQQKLSPGDQMVTVLTKLLNHYESEETRFDEHLRRLDMYDGFGFPGRNNDKLYQADYECGNGDREDQYTPCGCEEGKLEERGAPPPPKAGLTFHRGTILSGSSFVGSARSRDAICDKILNESRTPLCFEMEAAGVVRGTDALMIRGICDYTDSHTNKMWQRYAAGTAAAFARELVLHIPESSGRATQMVDPCYFFNSIGARHLLLDRPIWHRMKVSGMAIYELIYNDCKDRRGRVTLEALKKRFPEDAAEDVSWCWTEVTQVSDRTLLVLHHGMTLAVIYMVHLCYYCNEDRRDLTIPSGKEGKARRGIMRHFGEWVKCNCDDRECPCLWNFANDSGLCRNMVNTCQAVRLHYFNDEKRDYDERRFEALSETWDKTRGDPNPV